MARVSTWLYHRYGGHVNNMGRYFCLNGELYVEGRTELDLYLLNTRGYDESWQWVWNALPPSYAREIQETRRFIVEQSMKG